MSGPSEIGLLARGGISRDSVSGACPRRYRGQDAGLGTDRLSGPCPADAAGSRLAGFTPRPGTGMA